MPSETMELVMDYVEDMHHKSLPACSLTCRAWTRLAQSRLFHRIGLTILHAYEFSRFLDNSPHISQYVQKLELTSSDEYLTANIPKDCNPEKELLSVVSKLPNLVVLKLFLIFFSKSNEYLDSKFSLAFWKACPSIKTLILSDMSFVTYGDFRSFIAARPLVESLHLWNVTWISNSDDVSAAHYLPFLATNPSSVGMSHLRNLDITAMFSTSELIKWFISMNPIPPLEVFRIELFTEDNVLILGNFVAKVAPLLDHLDIRVSFGDDDTKEMLEETVKMISLPPHITLTEEEEEE